MRAKYGIQHCYFYNFDKTSFMMGVINSIMFVTSDKSSGKTKKIQVCSREWATLIICGNGEGGTISPFLIVLGKLSQQDIEYQVQHDEHQHGGESHGEASTIRYCSKCGKTGHNSKTCQNFIIYPSSLDF